MIQLLFNILVGIALALYIPFLILFFVRLPYIRQANVLLWGIAMLINILFMGMATITAALLGLRQQHNAYLFSNVLLVSDMGLWLLQYRQHKPVSDRILWTIFGLFFVIWCGEFAFNIQQNGLLHIDRLRIAGLFIHVVIVIGSWLYLIDLFRTPFVPYRRNPFFWLILGWLFYYTVTSTTLFTGIADPSQEPVLLLYDWTALAETISTSLYMIGFWKTKGWVIRHQL